MLTQTLRNAYRHAGLRCASETQILLILSFFLVISIIRVPVMYPIILKYSLNGDLHIYGHRTLKAPHPVRSAKLSRVPLSQYHGRGLRGNLECRSFFVIRIFQLY